MTSGRPIKDRTGIRYGKLVALSPVVSETVKRSKNTNCKWLCACDCGNTTIVSGSHLTTGGVKSCGCLLKLTGLRTRMKFGESAFRDLYRNKYKQKCASSRNIKFELSEEEFRSIINQKCYYCEKEPSQINVVSGGYGEFLYNGIDRIDNSIGYRIENCVPCCRACNFQKNDISFEMIEKITNHPSYKKWKIDRGTVLAGQLGLW